MRRDPFLRLPLWQKALVFAVAWLIAVLVTGAILPSSAFDLGPLFR